MRLDPITLKMMAQDTPFPMVGGATFSEDPFWRLFDDLLGPAGVVGTGTDYQVIQNPGGANMSVSVQPGSAYVAITSGGKRRTRLPAQSNSGAVGAPNAADNWLTTFTTADATNPRIDRVVLTVRDSSIDGSGAYNSALRVVAGTPTSGATLVNLNGAAAVPANSILLANVLVPNSATTVTTANISDQRVQAKIGGGTAQLNVQAGIVPVASTVAALNALLPGGTPTNGQQGLLRLMPATYSTAATALPAATIPVGDTAEFPTAGSATTPQGTVSWTGKTATTLTGASGGAGTLAIGATVVLLTGTPVNSHYEEVLLTYDSTLGKWVAQEEVYMLKDPGVALTATVMTEVITGFSTQTPPTIPWRAFDAAGLKPQLRWELKWGLSSATPNGFQAQPSFQGANLGDVSPASNGTDASAAGSVGGNDNGPHPYRTLWGNLPGGYTLKDFFVPGFQAKVASGNAAVYAPAACVRWVG